MLLSFASLLGLLVLFIFFILAMLVAVESKPMDFLDLFSGYICLVVTPGCLPRIHFHLLLSNRILFFLPSPLLMLGSREAELSPGYMSRLYLTKGNSSSLNNVSSGMGR